MFEPDSSPKLIDAIVKASRFINPSERILRRHLDNFEQYRERMSEIYFAAKPGDCQRSIKTSGKYLHI